MRIRVGWIAGVAFLLCNEVSAQDGGPAAYRRSYAAEAKGDYVAATTALDGVEARDYVYSLRRGWLLYLAGHHADSVAAYTDAISFEPGAIEPRLGVMLPLMALRRWREAEARGREVLQLSPVELTAQSRLGYIAYTQGRYAEAEGWYRKVLVAYPANVEMRAGLGWSLLKQSKLREAKLELSRVLAIAPDHASAKEGRAAIP